MKHIEVLSKSIIYSYWVGLMVDNDMVIHQIKLKYGDEPIFSSKYESVKKSYLERKLLNI